MSASAQVLHVGGRRCEYARHPLMLATGLGIVGGDAELAAVARFLDGAPEHGTYAQLLEGELGIGKSTVLQASRVFMRPRYGGEPLPLNRGFPTVCYVLSFAW